MLEVQEADYTRRFGDHVSRGDVVDVDEANGEATVITDLRMAANIRKRSYDCIIVTQTLHVIDQMAAVVAECHRMLKPGGVMLATLPCVSRVCLEYGRAEISGASLPPGHGGCSSLCSAKASRSLFGNALAHGLSLGTQRIRMDEANRQSSTRTTRRWSACARSSAVARKHALSSSEVAGLVLLYHRVGGAGPDPHRINLDPDAFDRQMAWLASDCAVLPLGELVERADRRTLPSRAVAITFDDGYVDTLTNAAPMLSRHGLPATCFVATEGLDDTHVFWWDRLAVLFLGDGARPDTLSIPLPDGGIALPTTTTGERLFAHGLVYHAIAALPGRRANRSSRRLTHGRPRPGWTSGAAACRLTNCAPLRARDCDWRTHRRPPTPAQTGSRLARREIAESRRTLERITGSP